MFYLVIKEHGNFFDKGELFEGYDHISFEGYLKSKTKTGKHKTANLNIPKSYVIKVAETLEEAKEIYPEYFL